MSKPVAWRKSHANGMEIICDPFLWDRELGDPKEIRKYRDHYIEEYTRLTRLDAGRPGVTGKAAAEILESIQ